MAQNLIHDGTFDYTDSWLTYTSYSDNKIEFLSTGGQGGGCVKLTVRSTGDPGLCSLSQNVYLTPGVTYALKFDVKREGDIDLWVQIASANVYNGPSLKPLLTSNDPFYKNVVQKFTMPEASYGETSFLTRVSIIAGSAGGAVWIDNVELTLESHVINPSTPDYSNCYVESTAYKYSELNLESDHTYALDKGSILPDPPLGSGRIAVAAGGADDAEGLDFLRFAFAHSHGAERKNHAQCQNQFFMGIPPFDVCSHRSARWNHPLMAPIITPLAKKRCTKGKMTRIGSVEITMTAYFSPIRAIMRSA